jgi:hypothetical protein
VLCETLNTVDVFLHSALYFRNMFGPSAEKVLSIVVALSALGNVMCVYSGEIYTPSIDGAIGTPFT